MDEIRLTREQWELKKVNYLDGTAPNLKAEWLSVTGGVSA